MKYPPEKSEALKKCFHTVENRFFPLRRRIPCGRVLA